MIARRIGRIVLWVAAVLALAVVVFLVWAHTVFAGERPESLKAWTDSEITIRHAESSFVIEPADGGSDVGLVFIPGAKVDPWAYAAKLSRLVADDGVTVVITRPWLNLAFFDPRPLDTFTSLAPDVEAWAVGGHSLGGVRACQLAPDADALVLFASYCANDLTGSGLPVLSLAGSDDGLSTPQKIADAKGELPAGAEFVEIAGASHASFGDYGPQAGDGTPTISDADMTAALTDAIAPFRGDMPSEALPPMID